MVGSLKSCGSLDDRGRASRGGAGRGRQGRYGKRSWKGKAEHWEAKHRERERLEYRVIKFFFFFFLIFKCCADMEICKKCIGFGFRKGLSIGVFFFFFCVCASGLLRFF